jgi:WD40 repeat protein
MLLADSVARIWNPPWAKDASWLRRIFKGTYSNAKLSDDGNTLLVVSENSKEELYTFHLLDINQQKEVFPPGKSTYRHFRLSSDGNHFLIRTSENNIDLYDRTKPQSKIPLPFAGKLVGNEFSPDGRYLAVSTDDKQIHIIDTTMGITQRQLTTDVSGTSLVFTHDNNFLLVSSADSFIDADNPIVDFNRKSRGLEVWSLGNGQKVNFELNDTEQALLVAISDDRIAMFQNQKIIVLKLNDGAIVSQFDYGQDLQCLAVSRDGKIVVTSNRMGFIELWNADSGTSIDKTYIGSPAQRIIFGVDNASFIAITSQWIHKIKIVNSYQVVDGTPQIITNMEYAAGIFTGGIVPESVRLLMANASASGTQSIEYLRWLRDGLDGVEIVDGSFDGSRSKQMLTGDSDGLLRTWQAKLGFRVLPSGVLEEETPSRHWYELR